MHEVVIIAAPRTGTNFFCECLGTIPGTLSLFEVFNPAGVFGAGARPYVLEHMSAVLDQPIAEATDPALRKYFRETSREALRELHKAAETAGEALLSYKVFPRQLKPHALERLISGKGRAFVFVVRHRLDTYISYLKASSTKTWKRQDTSDLRIEVDAAEFLNWAAQLDEWYQTTTTLVQAAGAPHAVVQYERDVDLPKAEVVRRQLEILGTMGIAMPAPERVPAPKFTRQDAPVSPFLKISNGDALEAALSADGRLAYALSAPLTGL
jgi:LPS sulfotransferase NodH